jgi:hypothetical protein
MKNQPRTDNKARTELERATGDTIAANNIILEEAKRGEVSRLLYPVKEFE